MVNASLVYRVDWLPASQRHTIVTPRLKKQGIDTSDMSNYRPVSNLSYISKVMERAVVIRLTACVKAINDWMSSSRLKLNPTKTEVLWLGSSQQLSQISIIDIPLQSTTTVGEFARDFINSKWSLSAHVAALCRTGFYHLRQLRPMLRSLTHEAARTLIQAFISSRLDYCNSLLYDVSDNLIRRVQSVQNAAARLLIGAGRRDHLAGFAVVALAASSVMRWLYKLAYVLSSRLCLATHLRTLPTTYIWSTKVIDGGYALLPTDRVSFFRRELKTFCFNVASGAHETFVNCVI